MNEKYSEQIVRSLLALDGPAGSVSDILAWIRKRNSEVAVRITTVPFRELKDWGFDSQTGNLGHASGKFFSIEGLHVVIDDGHQREWSQPIINQPEVGYLGIITKEINGVLCFLLQAKIEPGNINHVQLSPTLQATRSNYSQVHKGRPPAYLEYFRAAKPGQIILDQLQSEQGARFYRKRNRNMIIKVDEDVQVQDDFHWVTLGQIKALMRFSNVVNMDTRTVLSGISFGSATDPNMAGLIKNALDQHAVSSSCLSFFKSEHAIAGKHTLDDLISWLTRLKSSYVLQAERIPLKNVLEWRVGEDEISRPDGRFFRVIGVDVMIESREVSAWSQPIVQPKNQGISAFIIRPIKGVLHVLVQAKMECGNFDVVELAPTVQCLTGNYRDPGDTPPAFLHEVLNMEAKNILFDTLQSEEGGRFFQEQNRNLIIQVDETFQEDNLPANFAWMTLGQIKEFLRFNNYLNIQARSLISALDYR